MKTTALLTTSVSDVPKRSGKVRDIYDLGEHLLIVATDRISAYDVVMPNGIPDKGRILTQISLFWFEMLEDIALHYFELPFVAAQQEFDAGLAAAGKAVHDNLCDKCHSEGGGNPEDEAGILAGMWMGYLETTMAQYASGDREQDKKMGEKMAELSDADVTALVHYYASQQ